MPTLVAGILSITTLAREFGIHVNVPPFVLFSMLGLLVIMALVGVCLLIASAIKVFQLSKVKRSSEALTFKTEKER